VTEDEEADARHALSAHLPVVTWDALRVGLRIHYNSGWPNTSWTAEVRSAPVDDEVVVLYRSTPSGGRQRYVLLDRYEVEAATRSDWKPLRVGPMPRGAIRLATKRKAPLRRNGERGA